MKKKISSIAVLLCLACQAMSQSWYFRHYQVENGLSNNAVVSCVQDKKGFLWFGTKDGLDRFDGYAFKIFRNDPDDPASIGSNFIHSLYIDNSDVLYAGTDKGIYRYDAATEAFSIIPTPFIEQVTDITTDSSGNLWFISNFNLFRYHLSTKKLKQFEVPAFFEATSICPLPDGSVWVSTSGGLLKKYNPKSETFETFDMFYHSPKTASNWIEKIYATREQDILVGTSNQGVKIFETRTGRYRDLLTYNEDKTEIFARNFLHVDQDEYWFATESGIVVYNLKTGAAVNLRKDYNNPYSISDNAVYTFCKDKEGGIWAGTYFGGINYFAREPLVFTKYFPENGKNTLSGNVIREIHEDRYGRLWIGTEDAGLNRLDTATHVFTSYRPTGKKDGLAYTNIHGMLALDNELWVGTFEHGLDVMDIRTGKVIRHYSKGTDSTSLHSNFIYCLYRSSKKEIYVGTTIGAYRYDSAANGFHPLRGLPLHNWYTSLLEDQEGKLWASTYGNGLHSYDPVNNKLTTYRYSASDKNSISSDRVNSIFENSRRDIWVATENGLCKLNRVKNDFKRYTTESGLPSNFILSVLEDETGKLWVSTSLGLVCFDPLSERVTVYTRANGLLNDQFNFNSAYKTAAGKMYFGSVKGLISFDPKGSKLSSFIPVVYITAMQVDNKELLINKNGSPLKQSITQSENISLTHQQSTFSIDFASLSYTSPEMTRYAYKMEGLGSEWTYLESNQKVYFTQLQSGTYRFKVKAAINNGGWNGPETILNINILPPWWRSTQAYVLYTLLGFVAILFGVRDYHRRTKARNRRKIEQLELAKEKELYESKIQFFTTVAHEIKTPLTLIKGPLEKVIRKAGDNPEIKDSLRIMDKNTSRLIELSNQLLDFRQTEIKGFSLNLSKTDVKELIEDSFLSFRPLAEQKNLGFTISRLPSQLFAYIDTEAFNKILTNLLSNAVKYAESKVELVVLPVLRMDNTFTLKIKNDGFLIPYEMKEKIFEPFFRLPETEKQKGTGIGLALCRSLAQLQNGVVDLMEPEGEMNVFYLKFPLYQENV